MIGKKDKQENISVNRWISQIVGKKKGYIIALLISQMLLGIGSVADAMALKGMIDAAVAREQRDFWGWIALMVFIMISRITLQSFSRYLTEVSKSTLENCFKERLLYFLMYRDFAKVTAVHSGEWMNRLTSDTVIVANGLTEIIPGVVGMIVRLVGAVVMLLFLYPAFCILIIPSGVAFALLTYIFRKRLKILNRKIREEDGRLRIFMQESLSSMLVVRSFVKEKYILQDAAKKMMAHKNARMRKIKYSNICNIGFTGAMDGAFVIGASVCGYGILTGSMSYGTLMAVVQLVGQIQSPLANITGYLPRYYAMLASAERLKEIENIDNEQQKEIDMYSMEKIQEFYRKSFEGIKFNDIEFTYSSRQEDVEASNKQSTTLDHISFCIDKGEYVALMGPSGCGKSTLLKLLMCFYYSDKGTCVLKTKEKEEILGPSWRRLFAYVPQGNHLMSGTIRKIVAFGDQEGMKNEKQIFQMLSIACAVEFVQKLPNGIDTELGERGSGLSEGQMQRIAIARALFSGSPILIFDEATSALDEETEKKVLHNLRSMTEKTVLIVTHRVAVLDICDKEWYIENSCN